MKWLCLLSRRTYRVVQDYLRLLACQACAVFQLFLSLFSIPFSVPIPVSVPVSIPVSVPVSIPVSIPASVPTVLTQVNFGLFAESLVLNL